MKSQSNSGLALKIRQLAAAARESESPPIREAALATNALPVHVDMGGALAVTADGEVVGYDWETKQSTLVSGDWRVFALAKAGRRFPVLAELAPARPDDAIDCTSCAATGVMSLGVDCGACLGTGWISRTA